jgi:hypothetical protein
MKQLFADEEFKKNDLSPRAKKLLYAMEDALKKTVLTS